MSKSTHEEGSSPDTVMNGFPSVGNVALPVPAPTVPNGASQADLIVTGTAKVTKPKANGVSNLRTESRSGAESATDSEDVGSDWGAVNSSDVPNTDDSEGEPAKFKDRQKKTPVSQKQKKTFSTAAAGSKGVVAKKAITKRARANSASGTGSGGAPTKKRVRLSEIARKAPTARSEQPLANGELANFTTTIYIIELGGANGPQFHAHEAVLKRSPKLHSEIMKAKSQRRATKKNFLPLMGHDPIAFEQMLNYLYKDTVALSKKQTTAVARLAEIHELFSLAKYYDLGDLQKKIVKLFSGSRTVSKVTPVEFFDWSEDMWHEELDHENGPFHVYFKQVAPMLLKEVEPAGMKELVRIIKAGGGFAEELFRASLAAVAMYSTPVKQEEKPDTPAADSPSLFVPEQ